jgi:hypothetical protein
MSKRKKVDDDAEVYNAVVFQGCEVQAGPEDVGLLTLLTVDNSFSVVINEHNAQYIIDQLQDFLKGRAPSFARDNN